MEFRRQLYALMCVLAFVMQLCGTDTVDVTFTEGTITPPQLVYTLNVDPYDRMYNCIAPSDSSEKEWSFDLVEYSNPIKIYYFYEAVKNPGDYQIICNRKASSNPYVGTVPVRMTEGGHTSVEVNGTSNEYTSNVTLEVLELTAVTLTCSAKTGEWIMPNGNIAQSFPVLTLPLVTLQHNGTFSCHGIISGVVVFGIQVELRVSQIGGVTGTGGGVDASEIFPTLTPSPSVSSTLIQSIPTSTSFSSTSFSYTSSLSSTSFSSSFSSTSFPSSSFSSSSTLSSLQQTQLFSSTQNPILSSTPPALSTFLPTSVVSTEDIMVDFTSTTVPSSSVTTLLPTSIMTPLPTSSVATSLPTSYTPIPALPSTTHTSMVFTPTSSLSAPTTTSTYHTSTSLPTPTPSTFPSTTTVVRTSSSYTTSSSMSAEPTQKSTVSPVVPSSNTSHPPTATFPDTNNTVMIVAVALGVIGVLILVLIVTIVIAWLFCAIHYRRKDTRHYQKQNLSEKVAPVAHKSKPSIPPPYQALPTTDTTTDIFSQEIQLGDFKARVDRLWRKECNLLAEEYNALGGSEYRYPSAQAADPVVKPKNRYRNILPYDRSRVVLAPLRDVPRSDYINASLIPAIHVQQEFISAQGPKPETVADMWRMLWQNQVSCVVMLTKLVESGKTKCERYWPDKVGDGERYGALFVTLVNLQMGRHWVVRDLTVSDVGQSKLLVRHYQFTGWPDFDAPRFPHDLIQFLQKVRSEVKLSPHPICVHCSAGVGRSGTFITLFNLAVAISEGLSISVFNVVNELREHRPVMVQAFSQYKFIHLALLELLQGDTSVPDSSFPIIYQSRCHTDPGIFARQFADLEFQADKSFTRDSFRALEAGAVNPDKMVLPFDDRGVSLAGPGWDGAHYINASYVDGFTGDRNFIATQLPISDSVRDLMQLIFQTDAPLVLLLAGRQNFEGMRYDDGRIRYWPEPMTQHEFDGFNLMNENEEIDPLVNKMKLVRQTDDGDVQIEFKLVTLLDWTEGAQFKLSPESMQSLTTVVQEMESALDQSPDRPIILQCKDGAGACGVFIAVYNSILQMREEQSVDVFQTVKRMRYCRPSMVNSLDQYISVHAIVSAYILGTSYGDDPTFPYISSL